MNTPKILAVIADLQLFVTQALFAAPKTYQVTGPILELTDKTIVVQKGDERWEIARDQNTKAKADLKIGRKGYYPLSDDRDRHRNKANGPRAEDKRQIRSLQSFPSSPDG